MRKGNRCAFQKARFADHLESYLRIEYNPSTRGGRGGRRIGERHERRPILAGRILQDSRSNRMRAMHERMG